MIRVTRIERDDDLYPKAVELRERVLLDPIGISMAELERMFPGFEDRFEHFVAVAPHPKGPRVVGVVCLLPDAREDGAAKLMQMAVDPQRQGEGIGRMLVAALERRAFGELGIGTLFCHARIDAAPFYARLGWVERGERFEEAGIEHVRMEFDADDPTKVRSNG